MDRSQAPSRIRLALRASDRRRHVRAPTLYHLVLQAGDRKRIVSIEDISLGGVSVFTVDPPAPSAAVLLAFPKPGTKPGELIGISGRIVRQAGAGVIGIMFDPGQERTVRNVLKLLPALRAAPQTAAPAASRRRTVSRRSAAGLRAPKAKHVSKRRSPAS